MKKILCLLLIGVICMGINGCMSNETGDVNANIDLPKEVMDYLNELYPDDEFAIVNYTGGESGMAAFISAFDVASKKYNQKFEVEFDVIDFSKGEKRVADVKKYISDDYYKLQMNDDANEFFAKILEECEINAVVRVVIPEFAKPESPNMTFEDYLRKSKASIRLFIFSDEKTTHEQQLTFANKVIELEDEYGFFGRHFYNTDSDGTINEYTRSVLSIGFRLTKRSVSDMQKDTYDALDSSGNVILAKGYGIYSDLEIVEGEERSY